MPNNLAAVMPKILAQGLLALRQAAAIVRLVNTNYDVQAREQGDTIDIPIPSAVVAQNVTPSNVPPSTADQSPTKVQIVLDQWVEAPFYLTDKELGEIDRGSYQGSTISEAVKAIANRVANDLYAQYKGVYGYEGVAGTTPFGTNTAEATALRKRLNKQLAPMDPRRAIVDPDAEAKALDLRAFQDSSWRNSPQGIVEGQMGRALGFDWFMDQLVPTHASTALSAGAATVNGAHAAGAGSTDNGRTGTVSVAKATNASNLVKGDIISFAGDAQTYVVLSDVTLAVGNTTVQIAPALQSAKSGGEAMTLRASHVVNLGFHRDAFALAIRPLEAPGDGLGNQIMSAQDPKTGLAMRLEISREHKRTRYSFDILYGVKLVRPEFASRLAG